VLLWVYYDDILRRRNFEEKIITTYIYDFVDFNNIFSITKINVTEIIKTQESN